VNSAELAALRSEAEQFLALFGTTVPEPCPEESDTMYVRRMLQRMLPYSPEWRGVIVYQTPESLLPVLWGRVIADGTREAQKLHSSTEA
jgi:hypothetical protein